MACSRPAPICHSPAGRGIADAVSPPVTERTTNLRIWIQRRQLLAHVEVAALQRRLGLEDAAN